MNMDREQRKICLYLLPRALGPVGGDQDVGTAKRVVSPVGDVVEDLFNHCEEGQREARGMRK